MTEQTDNGEGWGGTRLDPHIGRPVECDHRWRDRHYRFMICDKCGAELIPPEKVGGRNTARIYHVDSSEGHGSIADIPGAAKARWMISNWGGD